VVPSDEQLREAVFTRLSPDEARSSVVYLATTPVEGGTTFAFGRITVSVPWPAWLAFVDLDPWANWTHPCRYICVHLDTLVTHAVDADLPPFNRRQPGQPTVQWRVLYRAPAVPATLLAVSEGAAGE